MLNVYPWYYRFNSCNSTSYLASIKPGGVIMRKVVLFVVALAPAAVAAGWADGGW
jgi:hypothetical protein